jgi:hypothetical protein
MLQRSNFTLSVLFLLHLFWIGRPLQAQEGSTERKVVMRVPVTIALVERMPDEFSPVVILRRRDATPRDVILLRSSMASSKHLSDAIVQLLTIRVLSGDTAMANATMRVRPAEGTQGQIRREYPWVQRVFNDLRKAEPQVLTGVGTVPNVQIWLPPQRARRR